LTKKLRRNNIRLTKSRKKGGKGLAAISSLTSKTPNQERRLKMDTSTSPKQEELIMGKPNSQEITMNLEYFLFRGEMLGKKEIPNAVWIEVVDRFLELADPQLKYIDGLKTLEQMVVDGEWFGAPKKPKMINTKMAVFPNGTTINKKTRGFLIATLHYTSEDPTQSGKYTLLVLTENRQWIEWNLIRNGLKCSSRFIAISKAELCTMLNATKYPGYSLMDKLYLILFYSRSQKERRLADIRQLEKKAEEILARAR